LITYELHDPTTGECCRFQAVQNEAFVRFEPSVTDATIRCLFESLRVEICFAWHDVNRIGRRQALSWFHIEIRPDSRFHNDVAGLLDCVNARPDVIGAGYNDVARLCQTARFQPGEVPKDSLWSSELQDWISSDRSGYAGVRLSSRDRAGTIGLGAWYSTDADLCDEAEQSRCRTPSIRDAVCVVVMDTGIDVDHPDFGLDSRTADVSPGAIFSIGGARQGICVAKRTCVSGPIGPWRDELRQPPYACNNKTVGSFRNVCAPDPTKPNDKAPFQDLNRAPSSPRLRILPTKGRPGEVQTVGYKWPREQVDPDPIDPTDTKKGVAPDRLKYVNLRFRGHGHGTTLAGLIGARGRDGKGVTGFGASYVKIMSATMRMVGHHMVDTASAIKSVYVLTKSFSSTAGQPNAVKVVLMGFAQDAPSRDMTTFITHTGAKVRRLMTDLRDAIQIDTLTSDRVWVAPASQDESKGNKELSYPAAILSPGVGQATESGSTVPAVLGVTGATFDAGGVARAAHTNFFSPDGRPDLEVYGVSGAASGVVSTDVRDTWYGTRWAYDSNRKDPTWKRLFGPDRLRGYGGRTADENSPTATDTFNVAGYKMRGVADPTLGVPGKESGRHISFPDENVTGPNLAFGNSLAAAQIAALAGLLAARFPTLTGRGNVDHIRSNIVRSVSVVSCSTTIPNVGCSDPTVSESDKFYFVDVGSSVGRVPPPVDFTSALETRPVGLPPAAT
jgi:hypothetical protein